jgi:hypothetical protein
LSKLASFEPNNKMSLSECEMAEFKVYKVSKPRPCSVLSSILCEF